ncbi:type II toxin-antitoxin system RelE/ParE family toxin [Desulfovibrio sp. JC010]|uniref:type II toxin-antitoxin system RelE/ParE family toxin n=1 Tax=Desulfovibrio sp. JC010 TaxID=2593641 RepID=UPI0013D1F478|nr:type II toxin-antitoxin system RelE/ParE family toxin [Desulfovibrio sp. JC010]
MNFKLTNKAYADLKNIARYTQKTWGTAQRNDYLTQMDSTFHMLAENYRLGVSCDHIRNGYRKYPVGKHLIFYHIAKSTVIISRILHQSMDVERKL